MLAGMAAGVWFLRDSYLKDSTEAHRFLEEVLSSRVTRRKEFVVRLLARRVSQKSKDTHAYLWTHVLSPKSLKVSKITFGTPSCQACPLLQIRFQYWELYTQTLPI